jgi:DNA-binding MarR family transcriptional regulator
MSSTMSSAASSASRVQDGFAAAEEKVRMFADLMWQARGWGDANLQTRGSSIRWDVLVAVARAPDGRMNYSSLETMISRPHRTLQYIVRDLEALGLVELHRAQSDRRRMVIVLTLKGRESFRAYIDHVEGLMRKLTGAGYGLPAGSERLTE